MNDGKNFFIDILYLLDWKHKFMEEKKLHRVTYRKLHG